ncbi:MAG: geranylgeranyl reductase family protein [Nitrospirae bacterium]|nr:geranylgeranyl reductase family protein [Candidatus Manganitrophaceae bacterium]
MRYDVIVVGGGPAGSTTARECAVRGLSVLLLDKAAFPRDKPCGGGITLRAARLLPFDLAPVTERSISGLDLTFSRRAGFARDADRPLFHLVQRSRFDHFLVEQAVKCGATLREGMPLRSMERDRGGIVVRAGGETFEGRTLVAADGANGETAKQAGLTLPRWRIIAMEGNITPNGPFPDRWRRRGGIDLGGVAGGYHWLFPKGDHLNIGIGGLPSVGSTLRRRLEAAVRAYGFDPAALWGVRAATIPIRRPDAPLVEGHLLLVGDAAGLADLLTGEGIYGAIWSGRAAAHHLAAYLAGETPTLQGYREEIERALLPELQIAFQMWAFFHFAPVVAANLLWRRSAGKVCRLIGWTRFCRLIQGEDRYIDLKNDFGLLWRPVDWVLRPSVFPFVSKILERFQR